MGLYVILGLLVLVFFWFWTEGFGSNSKYQYGSTIEKALKTSKANIISVVDLEKNKKLVFYEDNKEMLWSGLIQKKWNNKWIVIANYGGVVFELPMRAALLKYIRDAKAVWGPLDMIEFDMNVGVIYDNSIAKIKVGSNDAVLIKKGDKHIWYFIDKTKPLSSTSDKIKFSIYDVNGYDKNGKLVYSYKKRIGLGVDK